MQLHWGLTAPPPLPKLSPIPFWNFWNRHSDCSRVPTQPQRATSWSWLQRVSIFFFLVLLGEYLNESFENLIGMLNVKYFMLSCYKKLEYRDWSEYIQILFYVTILAAHLVFLVNVKVEFWNELYIESLFYVKYDWMPIRFNE